VRPDLAARSTPRISQIARRRSPSPRPLPLAVGSAPVARHLLTMNLPAPMWPSQDMIRHYLLRSHMRKRRNASAIGLALLLLSALMFVQSLATATDDPTFDATVEQRMFRLLNDDRVKRDLPALKWSEQVQAAARKHTVL